MKVLDGQDTGNGTNHSPHMSLRPIVCLPASAAGFVNDESLILKPEDETPKVVVQEAAKKKK